MAERTSVERLAVLETIEAQEQKELLEIKKQLKELMEWKREYDSVKNFAWKTALFLSAVATSLGLWIENIKHYMKALIPWLQS